MHTLILNSDYNPLLIVTWKRAINLYFLGRAEIIQSHPTKVIRSINSEMRIPTVIRLKEYVQANRIRSIRFNKTNIYLRDRGICQYCGHFIPKNKATIDHVIPKSRGGPTDWNNTVLSCSTCNQLKDDMTPEEAAMSLIRKPTKPTLLTIDYTEVTFQSQWKDWVNTNDIVGKLKEDIS